MVRAYFTDKVGSYSERGAGNHVDIAGISYQNAFSSLLPATDLNDDGKPDYVMYNVTTRQTKALYLEQQRCHWLGIRADSPGQLAISESGRF